MKHKEENMGREKERRHKDTHINRDTHRGTQRTKTQGKPNNQGAKTGQPGLYRINSRRLEKISPTDMSANISYLLIYFYWHLK